MSSKTYLVAEREYLENVRTKTFWIGIAIVPILIAIAIGVQAFLRKAKDVRTYAIVDHSPDGWLSREVLRRGEENDLQKLFASFKSLSPDKAATASRALDPQAVAARIAKLPADDPLRRLLDRLARRKDELQQALAGGSFAQLQAEMQQEFFAWFGQLSAAELRQLGIGFDKSRYQLVLVPGSGEELTRELNARIADGKLFAYFEIGADPLDGAPASHRYVSQNLTDNDLRNWLEGLATEAVRDARVKTLGLGPQVKDALLRRFDFQELQIGKGGKTEEVKSTQKGAKFAPAAFVYLLWIAVFTAAQMLLTNTIEEKSNRIIEVLLSSVSPLQLMAGKVLGIGATGLTIVGSWVFCAYAAVKMLPWFVGDLPGDLDLLAILGSPLYLASFVGYFLSGYLLYAAMLVGIGSVCNSLKEAQNLIQPVFIILMIPLLGLIFVTQDPNGTVAKVLTYIPLFTPFLMMNRAGGPPANWEYVVTSLEILVSIWLAFWAAAKVFRIGILMTGKPPRLREILGWLRAPVGAVTPRTTDGR